MKLLFIYGPPAVGKLTIANEVAALTGYKVFHNHVTFDLAAEFFEFGSSGFGRVVDAVRMTMFEVAASEGLDGLIFTFVYGSPVDDPFVERVIEIVERHGGEVCFVHLFCETAVLEARVVLPERQRFRKLVSPDELQALLGAHELFLPIPHCPSLSIDTSATSPEDAARQVVAHFGLADRGG